MKSKKRHEKKRAKRTGNTKARNLSFTFASLAIVTSLFIVLFFPVKPVLGNSGNIEIGGVNVSVDMQTRGNLDSAIDEVFYISSQAVNTFTIDIQIDATGNYVDWSTLNIEPILYAEGEDGSLSRIHIFDTMGDDLTQTDGGYYGTNTHLVEGIATYLTNEVETMEEKTFSLVFYLEVSASITDNAGNALSDESSFKSAWVLNSEIPSGPQDPPPDLISPTFSTRPNANYDKIQGTPLILEWVGVDDNPTTYEISTYSIYDGYRIRVSGEWDSGMSFSYDANSFRSVEPGDYSVSISCKIIDKDGQTAVASAIVNVEISTVASVVFTKMTDAPTTAKAGPSTIELIFLAQSEIPQSYEIYQNGISKASGVWNGEIILFEISYIYPGVNQFRCVVFDTNGNSASYTHIITASTEPFREIPTKPVGEDLEKILNSPFESGSVLSVSLWVSVAIFAFVSLVYAVRWWRDE